MTNEIEQTSPWPTLKRELVAILRGLLPDRAEDIASALIEAGFQAIEVPLNSPDPFVSIERIAKAHGDKALIGAGTVLKAADVHRLADVGGRLLISPNIDAEVMQAAAGHKLVTMPGVFTATEALQAVPLGASALKFFPASALGPSGIKAISAVLPKDCVIGAVGGVSHHDFAAYGEIGVKAFGLGSSLFAPDFFAEDVHKRAVAAVGAYDAVFGTGDG